jgi:hypothetical protein
VQKSTHLLHLTIPEQRSPDLVASPDIILSPDFVELEPVQKLSVRPNRAILAYGKWSRVGKD